ncbi:hypothetical protein RAA17_01765 [Komagataeibacter rhaeticus]|nr:hypothetical protein [Komagataeibacter rhaeticus]
MMLMDIRPIRDDADYEWALKEIEQYFDHEPVRGTPEADRFEVLAVLIGAYEERVYPIPDPSPGRAALPHGSEWIDAGGPCARDRLTLPRQRDHDGATLTQSGDDYRHPCCMENTG